jgi:hypothetical protein
MVEYLFAFLIIVYASQLLYVNGNNEKEILLSNW